MVFGALAKLMHPTLAYVSHYQILMNYGLQENF
jgi:hypothetical protein